MYAPLFGLSASPFSAVNRPQALLSAAQKAILTRLVFALQGGHGLVELVVEGSVVNRHVAQHLVANMPENCRCISVLNPRLSQLGFLHAVCQQLDISLPSKEYAATTLVNLIWDSLSDTKASGETNILLLNDAHLAPSHVLHKLFELAGPTPQGDNLIQVVLIGREELRSHLKNPEYQDLEQSLSGRFSLPAPSLQDTARYIHLRMDVAGWQKPLPFDEAALAHIHELSGGSPEKIDLICDDAIHCAQALKKKAITLGVLKKALQFKSAPNDPVMPATRPGKRIGLPITLPRRPSWSQFALKGANPKWVWLGMAGVTAMGILMSVAMIAAPKPKAEDAAKQVVSNKITNESENPAPAPAPAPQAAPVTASETSFTQEATPKPDEAVEPQRAPPELQAPSSTSSPPDFASLSDGPEDTWTAIGKLWGLNLGQSLPCADAMAHGHQCFRSVDTDLAALRDLNRPGLVRVSKDGVARWVQLVEMTSSKVTLVSGNYRWQMPIKEFSTSWDGAFSTLWRQPPGIDGKLYVVRTGDPAGQWLDEQLKVLQAKGRIGPSEDKPNARLEAFQKRYDLPGSGNALPSTFMRMNRLLRVPEPKIVH